MYSRIESASEDVALTTLLSIWVLMVITRHAVGASDDQLTLAAVNTTPAVTTSGSTGAKIGA
jgi:hypothetical protein